MAIIVMSHQRGAGGPEIGMALAQRLGYRYVNQELLLDAARRYGLAEDKLSHLDESKPTLFERFDTETRHHITVLQTTCLEFAEDDNCVLMRGGGQWLLRGVPHVLRARVIAPFEHRVKQWVKRTAEMTGETPNYRAAAELVRRDDLEKSGRMRYLYEVDIADPTLYELTVNTEKMKYDAVVAVLEALVRRPDRPRSPRECKSRLRRTRRRAGTASRSRLIAASSRSRVRRRSSAPSRLRAPCLACAKSKPNRSRFLLFLLSSLSSETGAGRHGGGGVFWPLRLLSVACKRPW